jgi:hypothetical protein
MAQHWQGKESRWGDRVSVNIPVQVSADAFSLAEGRIENLSLSGALVRATIDLGLHSLVEVNIPIDSPSRRTEAVNAYVSRKLDQGVGVEWCVFAPSVIKELLRSSSIPFPL